MAVPGGRPLLLRRRQLEVLGAAERGDRVAVAARLGLLLGEVEQDLGVVGGHRLEPADRLADREQGEHVAGRVAGEEAERRPAGFAEESGRVLAHAEIDHRVVLAVDDRQRHRSLRLAQGLVVEGAGSHWKITPPEIGNAPAISSGEFMSRL